MKLLLFLFIFVPIGEVSLFILSGKTIGALWTILLILLTGVVGAYLAKQQGSGLVRAVQYELSRGHVPQGVMLEGICIFLGGLLLLTPGFITDILGLLLLIPITRQSFKGLLERQFRNWIDRGNITIIR